jgi:purine-binding chemotaxis protein CheW
MEGSEEKVVVFNIGDEEYAAEINQVERILEFEKITRIPDAPEFLKGVINYQGRIIPVIDLKVRFNLPETSIKEGSKIIIAKHDEGDVGLIIDGVSQVLDVPSGSITPPPDIIAGIVKEYIKAIIKLDKRIVILLDLGRILSFNERKELNKIVS